MESSRVYAVVEWLTMLVYWIWILMFASDKTIVDWWIGSVPMQSKRGGVCYEMKCSQLPLANSHGRGRLGQSQRLKTVNITNKQANKQAGNHASKQASKKQNVSPPMRVRNDNWPWPLRCVTDEHTLTKDTWTKESRITKDLLHTRDEIRIPPPSPPHFQFKLPL